MVTQASFDVRADEVAVICREIGVKRLELVGRAASGINFDPKRTGIEFLVEFLPGSEQPWMGEFSELIERLAKLYSRSVEDVHLAEERIIKDPEQPGNPEYWRWIDSTRKLVYDAAQLEGAGMTTHSITTERSAEIAALCRELGVKRLEFVGTVTTAEFNPETDFVDIIVEFLPGAERPWMGEYSGLIEGLEALYGTEVLSVGGRGPALDDPEYREWVESTRTLIYEA